EGGGPVADPSAPPSGTQWLFSGSFPRTREGARPGWSTPGRARWTFDRAPRGAPITHGVSPMIRRFFTGREGAPPAAGPRLRRSRRRQPALEALEHRNLLSFASSLHLISTNPQPTDNIGSDVASSRNGTSVAVW